MIGSLDEVATLFDQAQTSVFKLMASVSRVELRKYLIACADKDAGFRAQVQQRSQVHQDAREPHQLRSDELGLRRRFGIVNDGAHG